MSQANVAPNAQLLALQKEFDHGFTLAPRMETGSLEKLLVIRIGDAKYAMKITDIGGLYVDRRIMPLPSPVGALVGMAGFRGQIAAVYDLAVLLGYPRKTPPRWLVLLREREPIALAFDAFEAHLAVPPEQIFVTEQAAAPVPSVVRPHLNDAVRTEHALLSIINIPSLLKDIRRQRHPSMKQGVINHE